VTLVSTTITIRVPRELREKMKENPQEWSEEVRNFIEERVRNLELQRALKEIGSRAEKRRVKIDSTGLIREDRQRPT
jgi:hypothetical protein